MRGKNALRSIKHASEHNAGAVLPATHVGAISRRRAKITALLETPTRCHVRDAPDGRSGARAVWRKREALSGEDRLRRVGSLG